MDVLQEPYTIEEAQEKADENMYLSGNVEVNINDIIDGDIDTFLDDIAMKLVGNIGLTDIKYEVVGVSNTTTIIVKVTGNISEIISE